MKQRTALFIASGLTAFVLVGLGVVIGAANAPQPTQAANVSQSNTTALEATAVPSTATQDVAAALTPQQALQIALASVPNATAMRLPELVDLQGALAYEVVLDKGVVYVDASTGAVLYDGMTQSAAPRSRYGEGADYEAHSEHEDEEDEHEHEHEDEEDEHEHEDEHKEKRGTFWKDRDRDDD